jgi:cysteinyl-tRNA synthetase
MVLKLYNTLGRKKQVFKPIKKGQVGMYTCGLTVYNYGHIGNYRAFMASDILRRYLEYSGYNVKKIVNITDVDDKTIKGSIKTGKELKKYTKQYEDAFFEDEASLNIKKADKYPRATEHIKEMVEIIDKLLKKGYAYKTDDGIYFNIKKFKEYGKLAKLELKNLKEGVRIDSDEYDKDNAKDFALWKFYDNEDGNVFWETKIGKGRPGWHIECSAMSSKYLGQPFDIHTGGIDLVFPHHENEIAQSEAVSNKKMVNYWIHNEWMMIEKKKMSKSLGNVYNIRDLIKMGYSTLAIRYFYLTGQYRTQINFTLDNLKNAQNSYDRLKRLVLELKDDKKENKKYLSEFEKAMDDDLNTPVALQVLWALLRDTRADGKINTIKKIDEVFGLDLFKTEKISIPKEVKELANKRDEARKNKDWAEADKLRDKITKLGYQISDTDDGAKISKL